MNSNLQPIQDLINRLGEINHCKFASFTYEAKKTGELARHNVLLSASYERALKRDIAKLESIACNADIETIAKNELMESLKHSLQCVQTGQVNQRYAAKNSFLNVCKNVVFHIENNEFHIHCFTWKKTVLKAGEHKNVKSSEKTLAKNQIRKHLATSRFRDFIISPEFLEQVKVEGKTLVLN